MSQIIYTNSNEETIVRVKRVKRGSYRVTCFHSSDNLGRICWLEKATNAREAKSHARGMFSFYNDPPMPKGKFVLRPRLMGVV